METVLMQEQAELFLTGLETRRRSPVKIKTLLAYKSYLRTWVNPLLGGQDIQNFENGAMRKFVQKLINEELSTSTIISLTNLVKSIIGSALDLNGNQLYPRKWNNSFIDLPLLDQREQKAPILTRLELETVLGRAQGRFKPLYTLLAGTGLRIGESLALQTGPDDGRGSFWLPEEKKLIIRGQMQLGTYISPKSKAGIREVDLCTDVNASLVGLTDRKYLFGEGRKSLPMSTAYEGAKKDGVPGYHSLRRYRVTHLRGQAIPEDILKFWIGHSSSDISSRYSKLAQNVKLRQEWAEKAGLGFCLGNPVI